MTVTVSGTVHVWCSVPYPRYPCPLTCIIQCVTLDNFSVVRQNMTTPGLQLTWLTGALLTMALARASRQVTSRCDMCGTSVGVAGVGAALGLWTRFPAKFFPLFLSPLIDSGRIRKGDFFKHFFSMGMCLKSGFVALICEPCPPQVPVEIFKLCPHRSSVVLENLPPE